MEDNQIRLALLSMAREDIEDYISDEADLSSPKGVREARRESVLAAFYTYEALVFGYDDTPEAEPQPGDEDFSLETAKPKGRA